MYTEDRVVWVAVRMSSSVSGGRNRDRREARACEICASEPTGALGWPAGGGQCAFEDQVSGPRTRVNASKVVKVEMRVEGKRRVSSVAEIPLQLPFQGRFTAQFFEVGPPTPPPERE